MGEPDWISIATPRGLSSGNPFTPAAVEFRDVGPIFARGEVRRVSCSAGGFLEFRSLLREDDLHSFRRVGVIG